MRAAIYARYSSDRQRESSIDDQVRNCTRQAERESASIVQVYHDKAITGAILARDGYQQMLSAAAARQFDILLVDDLSRLSRDKLEMERVLRKLTFDGIRVIGVSDGYDSASKGHKIHSGVKGLMNEIFLDDLRDKTHRGMSGQAIKGYNCGGRTYGYRNVPIEDDQRRDAYGRPEIIAVRYEVDAVQAEVVRKIFKWYAAGNSYQWIAGELNRLCISASRGGSWAISAIKVILDNEMYEGKLTWNRKEWLKNPETGKRTYRERPCSEWIVTESAELRIISRQIMSRVRARQDRNKDSYGGTMPPSSRRRYLFSGLMVCADCGGNFVLVANGRYGCISFKSRGITVCQNSSTVSRHIVEERLLHGIKQQLLAPDNLERFKKTAVDIIEQHSNQNVSADIERRLKDSEKQRDNIMTAIKAGIITETTKNALQEAEIDIGELRSQIRNVEIRSISGILPRAVERYKASIEQLGQKLDGRVNEAREIIRSVMGGCIRIHRIGDHLEAEIQNDMQSVFARLVGEKYDWRGCGGGICYESEFISLESSPRDCTPFKHRGQRQ